MREGGRHVVQCELHMTGALTGVQECRGAVIACSCSMHPFTPLPRPMLERHWNAVLSVALTRLLGWVGGVGDLSHRQQRVAVGPSCICGVKKAGRRAMGWMGMTWHEHRVAWRGMG